MNYKSRLALLLFSSSLWCEAPTKEQSIVEELAPKKDDTQYTYVKDASSDQTPAESAMLFHIPGLTITDRGGAMGQAQINYHGLSNSRFSTNLDGMLLNNPVTGTLDANSMFLFAAKHLQTTAQTLSVALPSPSSLGAKGILGYGSQNSLKVGGAVGAPIGKSSFFMATQLTSSEGNFFFIAPEDKTRTDILRENNDQHRVQTVIKFEKKHGTFNNHALLALSFHESGIAGYAFSPTKNLRSYNTYAGLSLGASTVVNDVLLKLDTINSLFNYCTTDLEKQEQFLASTHEFSLSMKSLKLPKSMEFDMAPKIVVERAYELNKTRIGGGFVMERSMSWQGRLKPQSKALFSMLGFSNHGLIFKKELSVTISPLDFMSITGSFMRHQRLPTFMELYANNSFFAGNDELVKESALDLDLGTNMRFGSHTQIGINGFLGFLSDTIVYVPFKLNQTRPVNITSARRYGVDAALVFQPTDWFLLESKNSFLKTKIDKTNAALPNAPMFSGLSKTRFGYEWLSLILQARYRSSATADIYGSIRTKPYILCDSILASKLYDRLGLSFSVSNIFNVKTARDTYEIPLSGTVFFAQVEVGNI
jgi:hypothetical protein